MEFLEQSSVSYPTGVVDKNVCIIYVHKVHIYMCIINLQIVIQYTIFFIANPRFSVGAHRRLS